MRTFPSLSFTPAPIALFAFNRPEHLRRTLDALAANDLAAKSALTIFCDGPRCEAEKAKTDAVRQIARSASGLQALTVIERKKNYGLATSVITGVTELLAQDERLVVLEDDLLTSPYFLRYINDGLELYADNPRVASIHGYCFPHKQEPRQETFFLRGADCWGWATWRRAWSCFNADALALLAQIRQRGESRTFDRELSYDYTGMLEDAAAGKVSSWAVRWLAATWLQDMYTLYPRQSLIFHDGSDGSGTHCATDTLHDVPLAEHPISVYPIEIAEDSAMARQLCAFNSTLSGGPLKIRLRRVLKHYPALYAGLRRLKRMLTASCAGCA